ncbi:MarR family winged helix-turn-helix transcriptional regulator [Nonomuraea basaltis]|uniref:MarR family winged helix-turn-helix transcriptional regulator n=1 Tax=Nonomuraea basaltis TaxID=2495887 RepID=UPI00110C6626|nr:MarR family winged helix-turn-helix transcriptional regulator [Nonomuraea basaltis]TMR96608.1 winged helix-turn-helix transcriptional regulator [Nonomuraea basaltis]
MNPRHVPVSPQAGRDYSLGPLLRVAGQRASAAFTAALATLGIEGRHFGVMMNVVRHGPMSQRRLCELTGSDKSSMMRTVDDLEARGLAIRRPAEGDRRAHAVDLTGAGRDLFTHAEEVAVRTNGELLGHLDPDEQEQLRRLLRKFVAPGE